MNVKSLNPNLAAVDRVKSSDVGKTQMKTDLANKDRDGNGRRERDRDADYKEVLTDSEIDEAIKTISEFEGVKNCGLTVELMQEGIVRIVLVKDPENKIIRRIPESELWPLLSEKHKTTGHILNKAG